MALKYDIAVIGGGASGIIAAIAAAQELKNNKVDSKIVILEKNNRIGKKLLATGNGRCNLSNMNVSVNHYHGDIKFLYSFLNEYSPKNIIDFFWEIGLPCIEQDEGRVYPNNFQAASVLDVLRYQLENYNIGTVLDFKAEKIEKTNSGYIIHSDEDSVIAKNIICSFGGMAYPQLGSDGSGFEMLKKLGHSVTPMFPALVQVTTDPKRAKPLKGARNAAEAVLLLNGKPIKKVKGEVQFTDKGLSGICIFELSRFINELQNKNNIEISLDLLPEYSLKQVFSMLRHTKKVLDNISPDEILNGYINKLVAKEVVHNSLKSCPKFVNQLSDKQLETIGETVKNFRFNVTGTLGFRDAQITAGGVPLKEVDDNMQSKLYKGLYLTGELLNIDGDCGGYNLHWAWSTGIKAGLSAAHSLINKKR